MAIVRSAGGLPAFSAVDEIAARPGECRVGCMVSAGVLACCFRASVMGKGEGASIAVYYSGLALMCLAYKRSMWDGMDLQ